VAAKLAGPLAKGTRYPVHAESKGPQAIMTDKKKRAERRDQQAHEIEAIQKQLRDSIAETDRLVDESDKMLRRHRQECDDDDA
jgi:hypothetical protein